jgi:uncharacterized protein
MHFFIFPSSSCNSNCHYCFGPKQKQLMPEDISEKAIKFIEQTLVEKEEKKATITFHGGEPLLAGYKYYKHILPNIKERLNGNVSLGIQSNLFNISNELVSLFKEYNVGIGTSLDGPEEINDFQRSKEYFSKNRKGMEIIRDHGMPVGCITTFTKHSASKLEEVFQFFLDNRIHFDVHAAVQPLGFHDESGLLISPVEFGRLLIKLYELYLPNIDKIKIGTLDTMAKNVANNKSGLCTFTKCLGSYLAIDPAGDLYTCNRFVGKKEFSLGNISTIKTYKTITETSAWKKIEAWQKWIDGSCKDCLHQPYCHGGCPYTAFALGKNEFVKDPNCEAYKMAYNYIIDKGVEDFFSDEHFSELTNDTRSANSVKFKSTPLLHLMHGKTHPVDLVNESKKIVAAAMLGKTGSPSKTLEQLQQMNIFQNKESSLSWIENFNKKLKTPNPGFNNIYLHITGNCNLKCTHCYSYKTDEKNLSNLTAKSIIDLTKQASDLRFQKVVFTGGEPLMHPEISAVLSGLLEIKLKQKLLKLVLRTNLAMPLSDSEIALIAKVFDKIVVSIDGSQEVHDKQRGKGAYLKTITNLKKFSQEIVEKKFSVACSLNQNLYSDDELQKEKNAVSSLKAKFPVKEFRFLPVLPLGRAENCDLKRNEADLITVSEWIERKYYFRTSCGLGQNIMVESNGETYPCHVLKHKTGESVGNVLHKGLSFIVEKETFKQLRNITVNTIRKCSSCEMRYLCGGTCFIWKEQDCTDLFKKGQYLFNDALAILGINLK